MRAIDNFLNKITMYRLVLYELIFLLVAAAALGFFGLLAYSPLFIAFSAAYIFAVAWIANKIFALAFQAPSNPESTFITAFILALIITPASSLLDVNFLSLAGLAAALASASKYILAIEKKHIFNPAAIAVAITAFTLNESATWWVGTLAMLPFVIAGGLLVVRKMQRFDLVLSFLGAALLIIVGFTFVNGGNVYSAVADILLYSPIFFLATIMLTEPFTTPPTRILRIAYGALVGFLFPPFVHLGSIYSTPELALLLGNAFSYLVGHKQKLVLTLKEKNRLTSDVYEFVFSPDKKPVFQPGQYMEWTLWHPWSDTRGIRRFFTIASSSIEKDVRLGVKFYPSGSSFKKKFLAMLVGETIVASERAGDFTLPKGTDKKLVFIAGGIGITPFRSMVQYLLDKREQRSIVLFYSNKTSADVAYREIFDEAQMKLGLKTVYIYTEGAAAARLDAQTIVREVPDYRESMFYLSGPHGMVVAFEDVLKGIGVSPVQIKKDFFPGYV